MPGVLWAQHPVEVHDTIAGAKTTRQVALTLDAGAQAITDMMGVSPHWYRAATAEYDAQAIQEIKQLGFGIAGFSVNADAGATLSKAAIEQRLSRVKSGDVIIAHMNKPASQTAEGLSSGLLQLLRRGFVFVRLDQVDLRVVP